MCRPEKRSFGADDLQIGGLLGCAARSEKKSAAVADTEVGLGGTTQWKLAGLDQDTTVAVMFEITGNGSILQDPSGQVRDMYLTQ